MSWHDIAWMQSIVLESLPKNLGLLGEIQTLYYHA